MNTSLTPVESHAAFRQHLGLLQALIEHSSDIIIISDAEGIERFISPAVTRILGYEPEELLLHSQYLLHHPEDRDRVRDTFFSVVRSLDPQPVTFSWRFLHKNGTYRWVEATASNQLSNPVINGIILNIRDITERKQFEDALREAKEKAEADALEIERVNLEIKLRNRELKRLNEEKNELMQMLSHDLKNPLYNLQYEAQQIIAHPTDALIHTRNALTCADRMQRLITNFLSIHAIESGRLLLQNESVNVATLVQNLIRQYAEPLRAKNLTVESAGLTEPTLVQADADAVTQVLDNVLSNAIKYSPVGGCIGVDLRRQPESVQVRVRDEGPGIPLAEADRLFQKFTRLSTKPTAGEPSTGLGLAIAQKLVHLLHGDIWYEPGTGATFVVEIPCV